MGQTVESSFNLEKLNSKVIRVFYTLSVPVAVGISLCILKLSARSWNSLWVDQKDNFRQIQSGLIIGISAGLLCGFSVLKVSKFSGLRKIIYAAFDKSRPTWIDLLLTSISAGFSEELLFRGALQPVVGIWIAALLFVFAHGVGRKSSMGWMFFGLFVFTIGVGLGVVFRRVGLVGAMAAHASIDLVVLIIYKQFVYRNGVSSDIQSNNLPVIR